MDLAAKMQLVWNGSIGLFGLFFTWAGVNEETYTIFLVLLLIDYASGILKAKSLGHQITSRKSKYGFVSKLSLLIIPIVLGLGGRAIDADFSLMIYWSMNVLILSEVYSIIGNVYAIRTGDDLPEYDALQMIGKRLREFLSRSGR